MTDRPTAGDAEPGARSVPAERSAAGGAEHAERSAAGGAEHAERSAAGGAEHAELAAPAAAATTRAVAVSGTGTSAWAQGESDFVERRARERGWLHGLTLLAIAVCAVAVLIEAAPLLGRLLGPPRSVGALRGVARAARAAGWARAPVAPPAAASPAASGSGRGVLPGFDPLGGSRDGSSLADRLAKSGLRPGGGAATGRQAESPPDERPALRLGVLRDAAKVFDAPGPDGNELGALPAGEVVVVASGTADWVLVAGTSNSQSVVGWTERANVVLQ